MGIKPKGPAGAEDAAEHKIEDIKLKDFIKIFRKDEAGDHIIQVINDEIQFRKKMKQKQYQDMQALQGKAAAQFASKPNEASCCALGIFAQNTSPQGNESPQFTIKS